MAQDPLRDRPQEPARFTATPSSILADMRRVIESTRSVQDDIVATVSRDTAAFANVIVPLIHAENASVAESNVLTFYQSVS